MEANPETPRDQPDRWTLIRDLFVFQAKLVVDGIRDLLLVPASLVAGIWSLVGGEQGRPGPQFYQLISLGKRSESWIDLFSADENAPEGIRREHEFAHSNMDELVGRFESFVVEEYERGGVTAQAKARIDKALDAIQRRRPPE
jgi:hypothetical protein